jgi:hypothetical protein
MQSGGKVAATPSGRAAEMNPVGMSALERLDLKAESNKVIV